MIRGINDNDAVVVDGFVDMHVHFREPGNPEKETIQSGTRAAKAGGYSLVCTMPNLNPAPDSLEHLKVQQLMEESRLQLDLNLRLKLQSYYIQFLHLSLL